MIGEDTGGIGPGYHPRRSVGEYPFIVFSLVDRREISEIVLDRSRIRG